MPRLTNQQKRHQIHLKNNIGKCYKAPAKTFKSNLRHQVQKKNLIQPLTISVDANGSTIHVSEDPTKNNGRRNNDSIVKLDQISFLLCRIFEP